MNIEAYPKNRREMDVVLARARRRRWAVRAVAWPVIAIGGWLLQWGICSLCQVHEESSRLIIGITTAGLAGKVMAWF